MDINASKSDAISGKNEIVEEFKMSPWQAETPWGGHLKFLPTTRCNLKMSGPYESMGSQVEDSYLPNIDLLFPENELREDPHIFDEIALTVIG